MIDQQTDSFASLVHKKFPVLDDGHVILLDIMGSDADIVQAARTSYGKGTRRTSGDRDLIRYLMRNRHSTPFEMAEVKLHARVPMDCWRQWIRHRTANVNEYSTRYSDAIDSAQRTAPDAWRVQSTANKQGSGSGAIDWPKNKNDVPFSDADLFSMESDASDEQTPGHFLTMKERLFLEEARAVYAQRLKFGVAREQARKDLPLSTYTEAVWKCDLHNVLHFLGLRMDSHAQSEIRAYADVIGRQVVAPLFPLTWEAFEDYRLNAATLSGLDIEVVRHVAAGCDPAKALADLVRNERERAECREKLARLGLIGEV